MVQLRVLVPQVVVIHLVCLARFIVGSSLLPIIIGAVGGFVVVVAIIGGLVYYNSRKAKSNLTSLQVAPEEGEQKQQAYVRMDEVRTSHN